MEKNVGGTEAVMRGAAGAGLLSAALVAPVDAIWRVAMGVGGAVLAGTAATGYCMINRALGRNSAAGVAEDGSLKGVEFKELTQAEEGASAAGIVA